jgi:peptidoglycan/LPS O-acetylase OafA/YrhL
VDKPAFFNRPGTEEDSGFRLDLEGVRALAILLVLLSHAKVPGFKAGFIGIDIFFVLSGFLITGLLFTEFKKTGTVSLKNFYAKRARRLLPLATTVLVFISICSFILYSLADQIQVGKEVVAASLYFVNWLFAFQGIDYFNQEFLSPVQHYWSLSVEEQFYLVWPGIIIVIGLLTKLIKINKKISLTILLALITAASFIYSLSYSETNQTAAYFSTLTRIWELGVGGLMFLIIPKSLKLKPLLSNLLIIFGFVLLTISLILIKETTPYPNLVTLLPVIGAGLFIVAGSAINSGKMIYLFLLTPVQYLGRLSYSIYLWHWPFIVFGLLLWPKITTIGLVIITLISFIPAHLSHVLIERPIHKGIKLKPSKGIALGVSFSLIAVLFGTLLSLNRIQIDLAPPDTLASVKKGIIGQDMQTSASALSPNPLEAGRDYGKVYQDKCVVSKDDADLINCSYGDLNSDKIIALLGDSHAMQWFSALEPIALRNNWRIDIYGRIGCPVSSARFSDQCSSWLNKAIKEIQNKQTNLVVISTARIYRLPNKDKLESRRYLKEGMIEVINQFKKSGIEVVVVGDTVKADQDPNDCVVNNLNSLDNCYFKPEMLANNYDFLAVKESKTKYINPVPLLCDKICPATVENINIYLDGYHITATFSKTLSHWFEERFQDLKLKKALNS